MYLEKAELADLPPAGEADDSLCMTADSLVSRGLRDENIGMIIDAAALYQRALDTKLYPLDSFERAGIENSLGSALCLIAQTTGSVEEVTKNLLTAERLLKTAIRGRNRRHHPLEWAITQTNLALVYIQRYSKTRNNTEMFAAVAALGDASDEFQKLKNEANLAWVADIEAYAASLRG